MCDSHSQAFTDMLAALEWFVANAKISSNEAMYGPMDMFARAAILAARKEMGE